MDCAISGAKIGYIAAQQANQLAKPILGQSGVTVEASITGIYYPKMITIHASFYAADTRDARRIQNSNAEIPSIASRIGFDGCVRWPQKGESISDFLRHVTPSQVPASRCRWIFVDNGNPTSPGYNPAHGATLLDHCRQASCSALEQCKRVAACDGSGDMRARTAAKQTCVDTILAAAQESGMTMGKWMFFKSAQTMDSFWHKVAQATAQGRLGCGSKVAPSGGSNSKSSLLCCVYVSDFANRNEVKRVLTVLKDELNITPTGFKPEVYTELGIGGGNKWGLEPTLYKVEEVLDEQWS